eukprot:COSAG05_NODE_381_length_10519_cov_17.942131_10_plen_116_part_00
MFKQAAAARSDPTRAPRRRRSALPTSPGMLSDVCSENTAAVPAGLTGGAADPALVAEAYAFRKLVAHLQMRVDVQNIDIMNLAGFCRNCMSKWYAAGLASQVREPSHVAGPAVRV